MILQPAKPEDSPSGRALGALKNVEWIGRPRGRLLAMLPSSRSICAASSHSHVQSSLFLSSRRIWSGMARNAHAIGVNALPYRLAVLFHHAVIK